MYFFLQIGNMAAAASATRKSDAVDELTECCICAGKFTDPKILPCIHSFCLKCLKTYGEDNIPGDQLPCPLCRTNFTIPQTGFEGLPNNYFVNKLMNINKMAEEKGEEEMKKSQLCDLCLDEKEIEATSFCLVCHEHLCEACSKTQKNQSRQKDMRL